MLNAMKAKIRDRTENNKSGAMFSPPVSIPASAPASASSPLGTWDDSVLVVIGASVVGDPVVDVSVSASARQL